MDLNPLQWQQVAMLDHLDNTELVLLALTLLAQLPLLKRLQFPKNSHTLLWYFLKRHNRYMFLLLQTV
jgi:hypothetical protein